MQIQIANKNIKLNILAFVRTFKQSEFVIDAILFNTLDAPHPVRLDHRWCPPQKFGGAPKKPTLRHCVYT